VTFVRDFYATVAQVLPVVLLALVWESRYFEILRESPRRTGQHSVGRVGFWTLRRVRVYSLTVATAIIVDVAACLMVLAGLIADSVALRGFVIAWVVLGLISLLYRIWVHVLDATRQPPGEMAQAFEDLDEAPG
jgi:hypothetical protein